jgi:hypothetical protein
MSDELKLNVEPVARIADDIAASLIECGENINRIARVIRSEQDFSEAGEIVSEVTRCLHALPLDCVSDAMIKEYEKLIFQIKEQSANKT